MKRYFPLWVFIFSAIGFLFVVFPTFAQQCKATGCVYRQTDADNKERCYLGDCKDPTKACPDYSANCGWVDGCREVQQVTCQSTQPPADACTLTIQPESFAKDFNGSVDINASGECFGNIEYLFYAYNPAGENDRGKEFLGFPFKKQKTLNGSKNSLRTNLNLTGGGFLDIDFYTPLINWKPRYMPGEKYPGTWTYKVCASNTPEDCTGAKIVGSGTFTVEGTPQGEDIPDLTDNQTCMYLVGSDVPIKVKNAKSGTIYEWWWDEGIYQPAQDHIKASGSEFSFTIRGEKTQEPKKIKACVDYKTFNSRRGTKKNCINLVFTATPPQGDTSCETLNPQESTATPIPPSPPCSKFDQQGGCKEVDTAIGKIEVTPLAFVTRVFSIILSLAGGIALLLIIYSGYKLMTSQGNAETIQGARETITSAIVGLLFIIFSLVIFQVIVGGIRIPGF